MEAAVVPERASTAQPAKAVKPLKPGDPRPFGRRKPPRSYNKSAATTSPTPSDASSPRKAKPPSLATVVAAKRFAKLLLKPVRAVRKRLSSSTRQSKNAGDAEEGDAAFGLWKPEVMKRELFELPLQPIAVSGGTAPFYTVKYRYDTAKKLNAQRDYWIAKVAAHAMDEVDFYDTLRDSILQKGPPLNRIQNRALIHRYFFTCPGMVDLPCKSTAAKKDKGGQSDGDPDKLVLLLQNCFRGMAQLRMVDIKLGKQTAVANWKGKSGFAACRRWDQRWYLGRNQMVDAHTNSAVEGYRMEGIESPPAERVELLLDAHKSFLQSSFLSKKRIKRMLFQSMDAAGILELLLDTRDVRFVEEEEEGASGAAELELLGSLGKKAAEGEHGVELGSEASSFCFSVDAAEAERPRSGFPRNNEENFPACRIIEENLRRAEASALEPSRNLSTNNEQLASDQQLEGAHSFPAQNSSAQNSSYQGDSEDSDGFASDGDHEVHELRHFLIPRPQRRIPRPEEEFAPEDDEEVGDDVLGAERSQELFEHVSSLTGDVEEKRWRSSFVREVYVERVLRRMVVKAVEAVRGLAALETPQQWVGSSIGLGFDLKPDLTEQEVLRDPVAVVLRNSEKTSGGGNGNGNLPDSTYGPGIGGGDKQQIKGLGGGQTQSERESCRGALGLFVADEDFVPHVTTLFDWGRSELNTPLIQSQLTEEERESRVLYWRLYLQGLGRLTFEMARHYLHRFGAKRFLLVELVKLHGMVPESVQRYAVLDLTKIAMGTQAGINKSSKEVVVALLPHSRRSSSASGGTASTEGSLRITAAPRSTSSDGTTATATPDTAVQLRFFACQPERRVAFEVSRFSTDVRRFASDEHQLQFLLFEDEASALSYATERPEDHAKIRGRVYTKLCTGKVRAAARLGRKYEFAYVEEDKDDNAAVEKEGKNKTPDRPSAITKLREDRAAARIQARVRGQRARGALRGEQEAAVKVQAAYRGRKSRAEIDGQKTATTKIQAAQRGKKERVVLREQQEEGLRAQVEAAEQGAAAVKIQSVHRGNADRKSVEQEREAGMRAAAEAREQEGAATKIQSVARGNAVRKEMEEKQLGGMSEHEDLGASDIELEGTSDQKREPPQPRQVQGEHTQRPPFELDELLSHSNSISPEDLLLEEVDIIEGERNQLSLFAEKEAAAEEDCEFHRFYAGLRECFSPTKKPRRLSFDEDGSPWKRNLDDLCRGAFEENFSRAGTCEGRLVKDERLMAPKQRAEDHNSGDYREDPTASNFLFYADPPPPDARPPPAVPKRKLRKFEFVCIPRTETVLEQILNVDQAEVLKSGLVVAPTSSTSGRATGSSVSDEEVFLASVLPSPFLAPDATLTRKASFVVEKIADFEDGFLYDGTNVPGRYDLDYSKRKEGCCGKSGKKKKQK